MLLNVSFWGGDMSNREVVFASMVQQKELNNKNEFPVDGKRQAKIIFLFIWSDDLCFGCSSDKGRRDRQSYQLGFNWHYK